MKKITRTISVIEGKALFFDPDNEVATEQSFSICEDGAPIGKVLQEQHNDLKFIKIISARHKRIKCSMLLSDFIANSTCNDIINEEESENA